MTECPSCGALPPKEAAFCPQCGTRLDAGETVREEVPRHETTAGPVAVGRAMPSYFGVTPPTLLFGLAAAALAVAIVLVVSGRWILGLVAVGVALLLLAAFLEVGRRKPDAAFVRMSVGAFDSFRTRAGYAAQGLLARSGAAREIRRRQAQLFEVEMNRQQLFRDLGAAVYSGDDAAATELRESLRGLDERAEVLTNEIREIGERAQRDVAAVQPTEVVHSDD